MVSAALPRPHRTALPRLWKLIAHRAAALVKPVRAPLANLASVPLHVTGLACIDVGVFFASPVAGWIVTGLSLIWLEHVIADEQ